MSDERLCVEPIDDARGLYRVPGGMHGPMTVWNVTRRFSITKFMSGGSHDRPEQRWCRGLDRDNANAPVVILQIYGSGSQTSGNALCILREVAVLRRLDHPNIVKVVDILKTEPNIVYVVFQDGGVGLDVWLGPKQRPHISADTVRGIMQQMVGAVGYLHSCGVVHRDIKPSSILIHPDTLTLKIANFGMWRVVAGSELEAAAAGLLPCSDSFDGSDSPEQDEDTDEGEPIIRRMSDAIVKPNLCAPCNPFFSLFLTQRPVTARPRRGFVGAPTARPSTCSAWAASTANCCTA